MGMASSFLVWRPAAWPTVGGPKSMQYLATGIYQHLCGLFDPLFFFSFLIYLFQTHMYLPV